MPTQNLRSLVGTSGTKVGTFLFEFATPGIGQILKAAGADFAVLDMEHTGFGFDTVRQVVRYCQAAELPLIVRVPSQRRHHISRALDTGADGVMVPVVSSVEQATAIVDAAKYWPDGTRGVALGLGHERFAMRGESLVPRFAEQNARTCLILQIEDPQGAAAADEIAAMPGVSRLSVADEHLATHITIRMVALLRESVRVSGRRPEHRVLLAGIEHERHTVGLEMAASVLANGGYEVLSLGADVPVDALPGSVERHRPAVVGLSATLSATARLLPAAIYAIRAVDPHVGIIIGGPAASLRMEATPGIAVCTHVSDAVDLTDALVQHAALN